MQPPIIGADAAQQGEGFTFRQATNK